MSVRRRLENLEARESERRAQLNGRANLIMKCPAYSGSTNGGKSAGWDEQAAG